MDAIVLLREDHKTVEKLFKRFEKASGEDPADERSGRNRPTGLCGEMEAGKKWAPRDPLAVPSADSK